MERIIHLLLGIAAALLFYPAIVRACHDGRDVRYMTFQSTAVRVEITGLTAFEFSGNCWTHDPTPAHPQPSGFDFMAKGSWDPATKQASEVVNGTSGWTVESTWSCPSDPWLSLTTYSPCAQTSRSAINNAPDLVSDHPFSASGVTTDQVNQLIDKYNKAFPPPPALPPRDVKASAILSKAHISWALPADQTSFNRTVAWFRVERRVAGQPQVAWFPASNNLPAGTLSYADPDPLTTQTEYRVCALNVSGNNCSAAVAASLGIAQTLGKSEQSVISLAIFPFILSPAAGQSFFAQNAIPIKLAPPSGWNVTGYMVSIQKKDASGNWVVQTNIPVSAAEAQSQQGYTGFGAGGNGPTKYPASLTSPGSWRMNAQISSPTQSGWSDWVEFSVVNSPFTSPSKVPSTLQKTFKK